MDGKKSINYPLLPDLLFYTMNSVKTQDFCPVEERMEGIEGRRTVPRLREGRRFLEKESGGEDGERKSNSTSYLHSSKEDLVLSVFQFKQSSKLK